MIFGARGLLVSFAFFAMLYSPLSTLVVLAWRTIKAVTGTRCLNSPNLLFGLRTFPLVVSVCVTIFFTFPSFWLLERASPDEDTGTFVLAGCSLLILGAGLFRVLRSQTKTNRVIAQWLLGTTSIDSGVVMPAISASSGAPPIILVGIRRPKVMVSDLAIAVLSEHELKVAIQHELGHMRSSDNLKKVFVSATPFPGMSSLESAWQEAAELAADDAAVKTRKEAVDLAAALIKLSRSSHLRPGPAFATALVSGPSFIGARVERLLEWREAGRQSVRTWPWALLVLLMIAVGIAGNYAATLALTHRLTELLVP